MYLFQPFINTFHVVFVVARQNPNLVSFHVLSKANITPKMETIIIEQEATNLSTGEQKVSYT